MATTLEAGCRKDETQSKAMRPSLTTPEPEMHQRGRRRVRSPMAFSSSLAAPSAHPPTSAESSTFRGRSRHRSISLAASLPSRHPSRTYHDRSCSPIQQRRLLAVFRPKRRRSQSPSRSRSANAGENVPHRRRQRTRSRSRVHRLEGSFEALELTAPLPKFEMAPADEKSDTSKQLG